MSSHGCVPRRRTTPRAGSIAGIVLGALLVDCREPTTWTITGEPVPDGVQVVIDVARELAPCDAVKRKRWGGWIEFEPEPFDCYNQGELNTGCYPSTWLIKVWGAQSPYAERTALPEELAHYILCFSCGNDCSEGRHLQDLTQDIIEESAARLGRE
ncbi:MAG: hypothetical protein U1F43_11230 [Myxococcota bacterium]